MVVDVLSGVALTLNLVAVSFFLMASGAGALIYVNLLGVALFGFLIGISYARSHKGQ